MSDHGMSKCFKTLHINARCQRITDNIFERLKHWIFHQTSCCILHVHHFLQSTRLRIPPDNQAPTHIWQLRVYLLIGSTHYLGKDFDILESSSTLTLPRPLGWLEPPPLTRPPLPPQPQEQHLSSLITIGEHKTLI